MKKTNKHHKINETAKNYLFENSNLSYCDRTWIRHQFRTAMVTILWSVFYCTTILIGMLYMMQGAYFCSLITVVISLLMFVGLMYIPKYLENKLKNRGKQ